MEAVPAASLDRLRRWVRSLGGDEDELAFAERVIVSTAAWDPELQGIGSSPVPGDSAGQFLTIPAAPAPASLYGLRERYGFRLCAYPVQPGFCAIVSSFAQYLEVGIKPPVGEGGDAGFYPVPLQVTSPNFRFGQDGNTSWGITARKPNRPRSWAKRGTFVPATSSDLDELQPALLFRGTSPVPYASPLAGPYPGVGLGGLGLFYSQMSIWGQSPPEFGIGVEGGNDVVMWADCLQTNPTTSDIWIPPDGYDLGALPPEIRFIAANARIDLPTIYTRIGGLLVLDVAPLSRVDRMRVRRLAMQLAHAVPPFQRRVLPRPFLVTHGDSMESIAERFGQTNPTQALLQLVGANLDKTLISGSCPSQGYRLRLQVGDQLRIPAFWAGGAIQRAAQSGELGLLGLLGDLTLPLPNLDLNLGKEGLDALSTENDLDPISLSVAELVLDGMNGWANQGLQGKKLPIQWQDAIANAGVQWWRQAHPNEKATYGEFKPFFESARVWQELYGQKMAPRQAGGMPWSQVNWWSTPAYFDLLKEPFYWGRVKSWLAENLGPEDQKKLPQLGPVPDWRAYKNWSKPPLSTYPWAELNWIETPWWGLPLERMDLTEVRQIQQQHASPARNQRMTGALIASLAKAYGKPVPLIYRPPSSTAPEEGGKAPPGGRPPGPVDKAPGSIELPAMSYVQAVGTYVTELQLKVFVAVFRASPTKQEIGSFELPAANVTTQKQLQVWAEGNDPDPQPFKARGYQWLMMNMEPRVIDGTPYEPMQLLAQGKFTIPAVKKPGMSGGQMLLIGAAALGALAAATTVVVNLTSTKRSS